MNPDTERFVLSDPSGVQRAIANIEMLGGKATHRFGPHTAVVALNTDDGRGLFGVDPSMAHLPATASMAVSGDPLGAPSGAGSLELTHGEQLAMRAYALRQTEDFAEAKAARKFDGAPWDAEAATPP